MNKKEKVKFDINFEEEILAKSLSDIRFLKSASSILDAHHFNTKQHAWFWKTIKSVWDKYKEKPSKKLLLKKVHFDFQDKEERLVHIKLIKKISKKKIQNPRASLEELSRFVRMVNAQLAMESAIKYMEKGNVEKVYGEFNKLVRKDFKPKEVTVIDWYESFGERQEERKYINENPKQFKRIPTSFLKLNKVIGGIEVGELGLVLATTHKGKSVLLTNFAHTALINNYTAAYFSLEMPARQIAMRQDSRWLKVLYNKFKYYTFKPSELKKIKRKYKKDKRLENKFKIISVPVKKCDINTIKNTLYELEDEKGFRPDLLLIDSGDHMRSINKYDQTRIEQASVYWDLKALAEEDGYAIWSSCHAGRDWVDRIATTEATSETYDKARIADIVLSLNTPAKRTRSTRVTLDEEDEEGGFQDDISLLAKGKYLELYLAKYRDGESRISIPLDAEFSKILVKELEMNEKEKV